ncbi:MAG: hypothetical protein HYW47_06890 [Deltaproteobacteria bacterium]|nr:hypothetical protein [Deltaproteobacteria bacterium]
MIHNNDHAEARKRAIQEALKNLLLNQLKKEMTQNEYLKYEEAIQSQILSQPFRFLKKHSVVKSEVQDSQYVAVIEGELHRKVFLEALSLVKSSVRKEARSRILIMLGQKNIDDPDFLTWWGGESQDLTTVILWDEKGEENGKSQEGEVSQNITPKKKTFSHLTFENLFLKNGYEVINIDVSEHKLPLEYQKLEFSTQELEHIASLFEVDYVLHGKVWAESSRQKKIKTFTKIQFFNLEFKKNILSFSRSFEASLSEKLVQGVSQVFMKDLAQNLIQKTYASKNLEIIIYHDKKYQNYQKALEFLKQNSLSLSEKSMQGEVMRIQLKTKMSARELKERIKNQQGFKLLESENGVLGLRVL